MTDKKKKTVPKDTEFEVTLKKSRLDILSSGIAGLGEIRGFFNDLGSVKLDPKDHRTTDREDVFFGLNMEVTLEGLPIQKSAKFHLVPKNRTIYIELGKTFPIKGDPRDPSKVEIDWDHFVPINGKKVLDSIVKELSPILKEAGYKKPSSRTFNCVKEDGLIHVINFQANAYGGSFTVNVAVFLRELRHPSLRKLDEKHVHEEECEMGLRWRIGHLIPRNMDTWWDYEEPEKAIKEVSTYLLDFVLPHLKKFESRELMKNSVEYFVLDILKSKKANFKEIFTEDFFSQLQKNYPPEYRTALFNSFPSNWWHEVVLESEKGIDGGLYEGSVKIQNAKKYSPWRMKKPLTVVKGELQFDAKEEWLGDRRKKAEPEGTATLIVEKGAMLFVARDLIVAHLKVAGEVHCLGKIKTLSTELLGSGYLVSANNFRE